MSAAGQIRRVKERGNDEVVDTRTAAYSPRREVDLTHSSKVSSCQLGGYGCHSTTMWALSVTINRVSISSRG